jgi:hypothetical protein
LASAVSLSLANSLPSTTTDPDVGRTSPAAVCSKVVLPDPDGPMTAVKLPRRKPIVSPAKATTPWPAPP